MAKIVLIAGSLVAIVLLQFGFVFLLLAMLPSVVAWYIDTHPIKSTFKTVCACNFAGTLPALVPTAMERLGLGSLDSANPFLQWHNWLIIYAAAAGGWCLVYLCRFIARFILTLLYEYRIVSMERMQKKLIDEWGEQIKQTPAE